MDVKTVGYEDNRPLLELLLTVSVHVVSVLLVEWKGRTWSGVYICKVVMCGGRADVHLQ